MDYPYAYAPSPMKNALGAASLTFGILTVAFFWVPVLGLLAFGTASAGITMGFYGMRRARLGVASNLGVATAGVVVSCVGLLLTLGMTVVWISAMT